MDYWINKKERSIIAKEHTKEMEQNYSKDVSLPYIVFVTKQGFVKKSEVSKTLNLSKAIGTSIMSFKKENDEVIFIKLVNDNNVIEVITNKETKSIPCSELRVAGKSAAGANIIKLKKNEIIQEVHSN